MGNTATAEQMRAVLKQGGHRMTQQRALILQAVAAASGHISAEALHRAVSARDTSINRSTVYRTLELLERLGFLAHHHDGTGIAYHHAGDHEHLHLACLACDHVGTLDDSAVAEQLTRALADRGFHANLAHATIFGVCGACAAAGRRPDEPHKHATEAAEAPR